MHSARSSGRLVASTMLSVCVSAAVHEITPHPLHQAHMWQGVLLVPVCQLGIDGHPTLAVRSCNAISTASQDSCILSTALLYTTADLPQDPPLSMWVKPAAICILYTALGVQLQHGTANSAESCVVNNCRAENVLVTAILDRYRYLKELALFKILADS